MSSRGTRFDGDDWHPGGELLRHLLGEHLAQSLVHERAAPYPHPRLACAKVLRDVLEHRAAELEEPLRSARRRRRRSRGNGGTEDVPNGAEQELVLVAKVGVEGRATDVRAIQDLLDNDRVVSPFVQQRAERFDEETPRLLNSPVLCTSYRGEQPKKVNKPRRRVP